MGKNINPAQDINFNRNINRKGGKNGSNNQFKLGNRTR